MMFRFEWKNLILPDFITQINELAGVDEGNEVIVREILESIIRSVGGLAIAESDWPRKHRIKVVKRLLHESIKHLLKERYSFNNNYFGYLIDDQEIYKSHPKVDINHATQATLETLPIIGPKLARRIIESRRIDGHYSSFEDLADRIRGLGYEGVRKLLGVFVFNENGKPIAPIIAGDFESDFSSAINLTKFSKGSNPLLSLLEELAVFSADFPHPASRLGIKRIDLELEESYESVRLNAEEVYLLPDKDYYNNLPKLLIDAQTNIDICMFFMALGSDEHPTRRLLDILVKKVNQGVTVRVLLDKDRKSDPYGSSIVNAYAAKFLSSNGVTVRMDSQHKLLHSKFVVIDSQNIVVGSHNWTAGSYLEYQDLSVSLKGKIVGDIWNDRFQYLWDSAYDYSNYNSA